MRWHKTIIIVLLIGCTRPTIDPIYTPIPTNQNLQEIILIYQQNFNKCEAARQELINRPLIENPYNNNIPW